MHPDKSLDPDGMNRGFFQDFWNVVGNQVTVDYLTFLNTYHIPVELN